MKQLTSYLKLSALFSLILLLPGCKWFEMAQPEEKIVSISSVTYPDASDTSEVLATVAGKPLVTAAMVEEQFQKALELEPQLAAFVDQQPAIAFEIKKNILQGLVAPAVIDICIREKGLDQCEEYRKRHAEHMKNATQMANVETFQKGLKVAVSDADVKRYYDEHKHEIQELLISRGGTKAQGVSFTSNEAAQAFADKVKGKNNDFEKIAKDSGVGTFKDFRLVNAMSPVLDAAVRGKIMEATSFPKIEIIKATDGTFWVVNILSREEAKYQPLEVVREGLAKHLKQEKEQEAGQKALDEYKKEFKIEVNENYFKNQKDKKSADAIQELQNAMMMEQEMTGKNTKAPTSRAV